LDWKTLEKNKFKTKKTYRKEGEIV